MELIECAIYAYSQHPPANGGAPPRVTLIGTDVDEAALAIARANVAAARKLGLLPASTRAHFHACDFRDGAVHAPALRRGLVDVIITNPPLGQRVRVANPHALYADFFGACAAALKPRGTAVFINPLRKVPEVALGLAINSRRSVDIGLRRDCSVEVLRKRHVVSAPREVSAERTRRKRHTRGPSHDAD